MGIFLVRLTNHAFDKQLETILFDKEKKNLLIEIPKNNLELTKYVEDTIKYYK